jgi:hypothetical protein
MTAPAEGPHQLASLPRNIRRPIYRIPLRVHLEKSGWRRDEFLPMLEEINDIWLSQAGICFEIQVVTTDAPANDGMDIWFMPFLPGGGWLNGYYRGDHRIQVLDTPKLGPADHPAEYPAARTAAHELGHGLGLQHRQDSDDNLMRSKTYGWKLNEQEIEEARETAMRKALPDTGASHCGPVRQVLAP